jgi:hypothetical protein
VAIASLARKVYRPLCCSAFRFLLALRMPFPLKSCNSHNYGISPQNSPDTHSGVTPGGREVADAGSKPVQHIYKLAQPPIITPVETKRNPRQIHVVVIGQFLRRWFDAPDFGADDNVGKILVHRFKR